MSSTLLFLTYNSLLNSLRVMKLAFKSPSYLPLAIIDSAKTALTLLARMNQLSSMSEESLAVLLDQILDSLLDERLSEPSASSTMKAINKVTPFLLPKIILLTLYSHMIFWHFQLALRFVQSPSLNIALLTLISLQTSAISSFGKNTLYSAKRTRVIGKLTNKAIISEHEKNPENSFNAIDMTSILTRLNECLCAVHTARSKTSDGIEGVLKPAEDMTRLVLTEMVKSKEFMREAVEDLKLRDQPIGKLLSTCEVELGMPGSTLASLIHSVGSSDGEEQASAIRELRTFKESNPDMFESHMLNLSAPFREFIEKQLNQPNKQSDLVSTVDKQNGDSVPSSITLNVDPTASSGDSFYDLKARIAALRQR